MKKVLSVLLAIMLVFGTMFVMVSADFGYEAVVDSADAEKGDTVEIGVTISPAGEITYLAVELNYDDTALELLDAQWTPAAALKDFKVDDCKGVIAFDASSPFTVTADPMLVLTFKVLDTAEIGESYPVGITPKTIRTADGQTLTFEALELTAGEGTINVHPDHSFSDWTPVDAESHERVCSCGIVESSAHFFGEVTSSGELKHQRVCEDCGYIDEADHEFGPWEQKDATTHVRKCTCGAEQVAAHKGGTATCTSAAICEDCGAEYGDLAAHQGGQATCVSSAICENCGQPYGEPTGQHQGGSADCKNKAKCDVCGQEYGDVDPTKHEGGTATCTEPAKCTRCGQPYGDKNPDNHGETETRNAKEATTSEDGYTGDICCKDCGKILTPGQVIPRQTPPTADNSILTVVCIAVAGAVAITGAAIIYTKKRDF